MGGCLQATHNLNVKWTRNDVARAGPRRKTGHLRSFASDLSAEERNTAVKNEQQEESYMGTDNE